MSHFSYIFFISFFFNQLFIISSKNQIINIKGNNKDLRTTIALHMSRFTLYCIEVSFIEVAISLSVLGTRNLFQNIQALQLVNFIFFAIDNKYKLRNHNFGAPSSTLYLSSLGFIKAPRSLHFHLHLR